MKVKRFLKLIHIEKIREQALVMRLQAAYAKLNDTIRELDKAEIFLIKTQQEADKRLRKFVNKPQDYSTNGSKEIHRLRALVSEIEDVITNLKTHIKVQQQSINEIEKNINEMIEQHNSSQKRLEKLTRVSQRFTNEIKLRTEISFRS